MSGVGAIQVFKDAGLSVPDDISVIVSDELSLAAHTAPPLTTVDMPVTRMGEVATQMLLGARGRRAGLRHRLDARPHRSPAQLGRSAPSTAPPPSTAVALHSFDVPPPLRGGGSGSALEGGSGRPLTPTSRANSAPA